MSITPPGAPPLSAYAKSGVNISLGDEFSAYAGVVARRSWQNNPLVKVIDFSRGSFRGPRGYEVSPEYFKPPIFTQGSDGAGTKPIITSATFTHGVAGNDLVAMLGGDITRYGGMPFLFVNDLSVKTMGGHQESQVYQQYCRLMDGLGEVAKANNLIILGGETAEMSHCISSEIPDSENFTQYTLSGAMTGLLDPDRLIDGSNLQSGHVLISLKCGLRANGISTIRRLLRVRFGEKWYEAKSHEAQAIMTDAAKPSVVFEPFFVQANGWANDEFEQEIPISLICHITGGGLKGKFADVVRSLGYSATLADLHDPTHCVREAVTEFKIPNAEAHESFCCSNGVVFAVPADWATKAIKLAKALGFDARACGEIGDRSDSPEIKILSKFDNEWFTI